MNSLHCPKCHSHNIYPERDRSFDPDPWILVCHTCGHRVYGEEGIRTLVQRQAPAILKLFVAKLAAAKKEMEDVALRRAQLAAQPVVAQTSRRSRVVGAEPVPEFRHEGEENRGRPSLQVVDRSRSESRETRRTAAPRKAGRASTGRRGALMVHCAVCNTGVWRRPWDVKSCKSGLFFCCTEHRLQYLRSGQALVTRDGGLEAAS